jgi:hypothetical protein
MPVGNTLPDQPMICDQRILQGSWKGIFRSKAVGNDQDARTTGQSQTCSKGSVCIYGTETITSTVQVQNDLLPIQPGGFKPFGMNSICLDSMGCDPFGKADTPASQFIETGTLFLNGQVDIQGTDNPLQGGMDDSAAKTCHRLA